ncbi:hypothetical protein [Paraflavitalea speifideaquila]|uniref:hypothetical protein n=1 Tax=Paraflavitalea speifideaquila TaxID=3076558 RepID=UPI0028E54B82|nr:hypothetical protein [Paraflavitalea speifideiaquila]
MPTAKKKRKRKRIPIEKKDTQTPQQRAQHLFKSPRVPNNASKVVGMGNKVMVVSKARAAVSSGQVKTVEAIAALVRDVLPLPASPKRSTKKRSRIKYAKPRPNWPVPVVAVRASRLNTVAKNARNMPIRVRMICRTTNCR